ncbi:MAG: arginine repressor [Clostridia bacterium]|nr:arginine repressor [Clostridia bacterium]
MKKNRQALIARIISENKISTQEELLDLLLASGMNATQATVSRDIKEMKIVKRADAMGDYRYSLPSVRDEQSHSKYMSILTGTAIKTDIAMNTVVVKCHVGTAQAACAALDRIGLENVAGTLAGDDTIFVLCYTPEAALGVRARLDELFGF